MKKIIALTIAFLLVLSYFCAVSAAENAVYVAPYGSDSNNGSVGSPLKTLAKAVEKVRGLKVSGAVTVYFMGGEYNFTSTVTLSSQDSGTADKPITYKNYNGAEVTFTGCETIPASNISFVTDSDLDKYGNKVMDRITSDEAKRHLMKIDLSGFSGSFSQSADRGWSYGKPKLTEVYVNNEVLGQSRFPDDEELGAMHYAKNGTSGKRLYYDDSEVISTWNSQAVVDDLFLCSWLSSYWYNHDYKVGSIDKTNGYVDIKNNAYASFQSGKPYYFYNILEAISAPGESFIDRDRKIAYFYPASEIDSDADVKVSNFNGNMVNISGANYINFEGIDFKYTLETPINISSNNVTFKDCVIAHTSNKAMNISGKNITVDSCHIFDTAYGGIEIYGGDRKTLTPSNNVIINSIFHSVDRLCHNYAGAINIRGVGMTIKNNLFYDTCHQAVQMNYSTNNITIENNEFYHCVTESGDMGAVYWGRDPSTLGVKIIGNYFHEIGNPYNKGFNQSIFGDDGNIGAYIFGNVFYQGTLTTENGGNTSQSFPVKTNGGQYYYVENNVIIDSPTACYFQEWVGTGFSNHMQSKYILYNNDVEISGNNVTGSSGQWSKIFPYLSNQTWKDYYKGTQWEVFFNDFSVARYNAIQGYKNSNDKAGLISYITPFVPKETNTFSDNVNIKITNKNILNGSGNAKVSSNYSRPNEFTNSGKPIFEDFANKDFSLTSDALTEIRKVSPNFKDIEFDKMGLLSDVDGHAPNVTSASVGISGDLATVSYEFYDPDSDKEGRTRFEWYVSETQNGKYERLYGCMGPEHFFNEQDEGKYLKVKIIPVDQRGRFGKTFETNPILIATYGGDVDKTPLKTAIDDLKSVIANAKVGTTVGCTSQEALDELKNVLTTAEGYYNSTNVYRYQITNQVATIKNAISAYNSKIITPIDTISISEMIQNQSSWVSHGTDKLTFTSNSITVPKGGSFVYTGKQFKNTLFTFKLKFGENHEVDVNKTFTFGAFYFRQKESQNRIWSGTNTGYLLWIKNTIIESQIWQPKNVITEYVNDKIFELGSEYLVKMGVYDAGDESVRFLLYVDDKLIIDKIYTKDEFTTLYGGSGYFGVSSGECSITIEDVLPNGTFSAVRSGSSVNISASTEKQGVVVIFANYEGEKLTAIKQKTVNLKVGSNTVTADGFTANSSTKVFVLDGYNNLIPLCKNA